MAAGADLFLFERNGHPSCGGNTSQACDVVPAVEQLYHSLLLKLSVHAHAKEAAPDSGAAEPGANATVPGPGPELAPPPLVLLHFPWLLSGQREDACMRGFGRACGACSAAHMQRVRDRLYYQVSDPLGHASHLGGELPDRA